MKSLDTNLPGLKILVADDDGALQVVHIVDRDGSQFGTFVHPDRAAALAYVLTASPEALRARFLSASDTPPEAG